MRNKKTKLNLLAVLSEGYAEGCFISDDLKKCEKNEDGSFKEFPIEKEIEWPIAHYIGASYNFQGEDSKIKSAIGLAGYIPIAHENFNEFYGSLKGVHEGKFKFKSLKNRANLEKMYCSSKDIIICPWDGYYSPKGENIIKKIEKEEIILDSLELSNQLKKEKISNKVDLIIYDKGFGISPLRDKVNYELGEYEEDLEEIKMLKKIKKKYNIELVEKINLAYPYALYEHLRTKNKDLFF